ncbi:MAG: dGTP triphosphohydrolase [Pseudomonadota bacterium]
MSLDRPVAWPKASARAPYACNPPPRLGQDNQGFDRRTTFQRDRDRILHANAFRKLQGKTQVFSQAFSDGQNDYYRTRLTHSLEVAQIARGAARALAVDEDLTEAIALAHDLGHPPFGHTGEEVLDDFCAPVGGFDHNVQALRIVIELERMYAAFDGLGLSPACLEGLIKHNGPIRDPAEMKMGALLGAYDQAYELDLSHQTSLEGQIAAWADDVAYLAHDFQDGVRSGVLDPQVHAPLIVPIRDVVNAQYPGVHPQRLAFEVARRLIDACWRDMIGHTRKQLLAADIQSLAAVRDHPDLLVANSPALQSDKKALRAFMKEHLYHHDSLTAHRAQVPDIIMGLTAHYQAGHLPPDWQDRLEKQDPKRVVADYIAGMTDRFALQRYKQITDPSTG